MIVLRLILVIVVLFAATRGAMAAPTRMSCRDVGWLNALRAAHDIPTPLARSQRLAVLFATDEWRRALGGLMPFMSDQTAQTVRLFVIASREPPHTVSVDLHRSMAALRLPPFCADSESPPYEQSVGTFGGWDPPPSVAVRTAQQARGVPAKGAPSLPGMISTRLPWFGGTVGFLCVLVALIRRETNNARRSRRYPCQIAVSIDADGRVYSGTIRDLSQSGCQLQSQDAVQLDPADALVIQLPDGKVTAAAIWQSGSTSGLRFKVILDAKRLRRLIRKPPP
ncbi:PilZ domain protein [Rhodobacteraceae bacterium THAF1]|uniref:PilZ domain-containing protein n=1 Tax=Palleronia sp. THAF1 TaxID=2587842 RepID=UPI000F3B9177|nr:PilZ domain-containing protein [Palleronia sp. THAF1]QFU08252.1 PilZ domain protein [Palleronia sp. THAF1]VDC28812.1 PilZ domain protein [Rhodobacteraceae bacterium THAF1]